MLNIYSVKVNNKYKVKFHVDTIGHLKPIPILRANHDLLYLNNGYSVYNVTEGDLLIYTENPESYLKDNITKCQYILLQKSLVFE